MISNIGAKISYPITDLQKLAKYANGVPLREEKNDGLKLSEVTNYPLTLLTWESLSWLKNNWGHYGEAFKNISVKAKEANEILKSGGAKSVLRVMDAKNVLAAVPEAEALNKLSSATQSLYKSASTAAQDVIKNPISKSVKDATLTLAKANAEAYKESLKDSTSVFSKIKTALGITTATKAVNALSAKSTVFSKCVNAYNEESGTLMLALEGGIETAVNVVPTFKELGFKRGMKQLGKSALKTVMSVAGWVAGSAVGSKIGAVSSAALGGKGKVATVISSALNTVCSYVGGTIAQHFSSKAASKLTGKDELEKARIEKSQFMSEASQSNEEILADMLDKVAKKLQNESEDSEEAKEVAQSLQNILIYAQQVSGPISSDAPLMTKPEMREYAKKLKSPELKTTVKETITTEIGTNKPAKRLNGFTEEKTTISAQQNVQEFKNEQSQGIVDTVNETQSVQIGEEIQPQQVQQLQQDVRTIVKEEYYQPQQVQQPQQLTQSIREQIKQEVQSQLMQNQQIKIAQMQQPQPVDSIIRTTTTEVTKTPEPEQKHYAKPSAKLYKLLNNSDYLLNKNTKLLKEDGYAF